MGSFLGTLVLRLPHGRPILFARSTCDSCGRTLSPLQLIPVLSWVVQRGSCSACGAKISLFYPAMEIAAAGIALWAGAVVSGVTLLLSLGLGWCLLALAVMDARTFRLSDALTLPLIAGGIIAGWLLEPEHILSHLIGAVTGWAGFLLLNLLYRTIRHRSGLGQGDAKLLAAGGAWLGWQGLGSVLLVASVAALLGVLVLQVSGRKIDRQTPLAFGAFLCIGIWVVRLYGPIVS
ncbi:MAG: A24 family peptidase [Rhizomicrobium sp.]